MENRMKSTPRRLVGAVAAAFALLQPGPPLAQSPTLSTTIADYARAHQFNGTVLVEENGTILYQQSFGIADRAFLVPVQNDTLFKIASITKAFTSVLVLRLFEEGKIDLEQPIVKYLPAYSGEAGTVSTIHELLNHTSGMQNIDAGLTSYDDAVKRGMEHYQLPFTTEQMMNRFCSGKLVHEPGKAFDYNNCDYILLGKIVERIEGKRFDDVLAERILRPLGMASTGLLYQAQVVRDLAPTYFTADKGQTFVNDLPVYVENWFAAGAMYSKASDLLSFANALYGFKLLKPATLDLMLTPGLDDYGFGMWIGFPEVGGRKYRVVNRPGAVMGANGSLRHFNGIGFNDVVNVVILSNTNATNLDDFSYMIGRTLLVLAK
jgi:CubicO group peptidase (beta-lactamase class C family)